MLRTEPDKRERVAVVGQSPSFGRLLLGRYGACLAPDDGTGAPAAAAEPAAAPPAAAEPAAPASLLADPAAPAPAADPAQPAAPAAPVIPETYEFKAPEGVAVNEADVEWYRGVAKEAGLSQEQFDKLATVHAEKMQQVFQQPVRDWMAQQNTWRDAALADPEIGDGKALTPEASKNIAAGIEFLGPELRDELNRYGLGVNPVVIKAIAKIGKASGQPGPLGTGAPLSAEQDRSFAGVARTLYPNMAGA